MRLGIGFFTCSNELFHKLDVCVVNNLRVAVAVHGCKVDDGVALGDEVLEFFVILKEVVFKRDSYEFVGLQAEGVVEVRANEAGLSRYSYF